MRVTYSTEMAIVECCVCGCNFGIPQTMQGTLRENKTPFYCPSGHLQSYTISELEIVKKELEKQTDLADKRGSRIDEIGLKLEVAEKKLKRCENKPKK